INFDKTDYYTQIKSDFTFGDLHWTDVYDCNFLLPENPMWIVSAHDDFDILEYTLNVANWLEIDESTVVVNLVYGGVSHTMSSTFLDPETLLVQFYKNELFDTYTIEIEYDYKDTMFNLGRHGSFKEENVASLFPTRTFAITNEGGGFDSDGNFIAQYSSNCYQNGLYFVIEYHYTINLLGGGTDSNTVSCVLPPNDTAVMSAPAIAVPEEAVSIEYYFTLDAQGPNGGIFTPGFIESDHEEEVIIANSYITVNDFYFDVTDGADVQLDVSFDYLSLNDPVFITIEDTDGGVYDLPAFDDTTMMKDAYANIQFALPMQLSFQMKMYKFGTDELIAETSDLMEFKVGAASSISSLTFAQTNPGDYAVTFNDDDTMNIYQKSGFVPDSSKDYLHELIRFSYEENGFMKMKYLEISEFDQDVRLENVPMYNYYISYGVCAEVDGSNYFGNRVVPSGGIEIPDEINLWYYTSNNTELNVSLYSYVYDEPVFDFYVHTTLESKYDVEPIHYVATGAYPMGYPDISYDFGAESTGKELAFDVEFKYMYGSDPLNVLNNLNNPYKGEPYKVISTSGSVSLGA
ncbi:MAG: hypothetical protein MJ220_00945, partial [Bacilli bacterium]|nr:hypothetical protein [Bacilli bacterium]